MNAASYSQIFDTSAAQPCCPVDLTAIAASGKLLLGSFCISIDLPEPDKLAAFILVIHEPYDVLRRIAEEKTYLMGEIPALAHPLGKMRDAGVKVLTPVSHLRQDALGCRASDILFQSVGTENIDEDMTF